MGEKLVIGPMSGGLKQNPLAFYIDNDSFPQLVNAYPWRGRIKRKRGTSILGRLNRLITSTLSNPILTLNGAGAGSANLISVFSLESDASFVQASFSLTDGTNTYTDLSGVLTGAPGGTGSINYATGAISITGGAAGGVLRGTFKYYPDLPVMGLEDLNLDATQFPGTIAFDTVYSYDISTSSPYTIKSVSYYKNPQTGTYSGYTAKSAQTPITWNGEDYQQFWSVNYQDAFWVTNGTRVPFSGGNIGMQFANAASIAYVSNTATTIVVTIAASPLVVGDFVFLNEWTGANSSTLNFQTGYVTSIAGPNITITLPNAAVGAGPYTPGIIQYLTNRSDVTKDCLRFYDGDPTINFGENGWVNFMPPLFSGQPTVTIDDNPPAQYYLVGARVIANYKDRLLFFGAVIQTSTGSPIYTQDTVIYSQNGTPFYTASFAGTLIAPTNIIPILTPTSQTATATAWVEDLTGFGGSISAGYAQPIISVSPNEDTLILGFSNRQARFVYTGNDIIPFNFYIINSELGTGSTFSIINMDRGILSIGNHGIIITAQIGAQRIDIDIPDQVFQFNLLESGTERITAQRDFVNEWVYFTYPDNEVSYRFPNQTLLYNYRDGVWGLFNECYTTYGQFRKSTGQTWATIGNIFPTWASWTEPWNSGSTTLLQPTVIAGNPQGFVVFRDDGTNESNSLYIQSFSGSTITSPDHCLNSGDYIVISGCLGTIGSIVNGNIYSVTNTTDNTFKLDPSIASGTYLGGGLIKRMYIPFIQSKQFNPSWGMGRKTRLGVQQYLLTSTYRGQVSLQIYLSQGLYTPYNTGPIVPTPNSDNDALIYSTILYTCPESTNLGLTPANINLQMVTAANAFQQQQIWHRMNTSLIGDTVQFGITLNDDQMRDTAFNSQFSEVEFHGVIIDVTPSQMLS